MKDAGLGYCGGNAGDEKRGKNQYEPLLVLLTRWVTACGRVNRESARVEVRVEEAKKEVRGDRYTHYCNEEE